MNGILIVNKPQKFTSFDVVAILRKILSMKKIGHGGTLDPMATGVLPIFLGNATKIIDVIPDQDKKYIASFKLGISTSTYDIWGETTSETKSAITKQVLTSVINRFTGNINQVPPMYSAIKINGEKLYNLARQGKEIERPARPVTIHDIKLLAFDEALQEATIETHVSKGTYIRSLIHDIGNNLDVGATMTSLSRNFALGFDISQSYTIDEIKDFQLSKELDQRLIKTEDALCSLPEIFINNTTLEKISNGVKVDIDMDKNKYYRVYSCDKTFLGIGIYKDNNVFKFKLR